MKCVICGKEFIHLKLRKNTCSRKCKKKQYYELHKKDVHEQQNKYHQMKRRTDPDWIKKQTEYVRKFRERRRKNA